MSDHRPEPEAVDRNWYIWPSVAVGCLLVFGALLAFVIVPAVQGGTGDVGAWAAICRAVGVSPGSPAVQQPLSAASAQPVSEVSWEPKVIRALHNANREEGSTIASGICVACHGENGISTDPQFPNLSGQSIFAIYKELHDFKSGARQNDVMTPMAQQLSDEQMANVAGFYSHFARGTVDPQRARETSAEVRALIEQGDTARDLPACNGCHGERAGGPIETPTLTGQQREYLERQLQAFSSGARRNDLYGRMRSIAAELKPEEMKALAGYYASAKLPGQKSADGAAPISRSGEREEVAASEEAGTSIRFHIAKPK
jgi:cytochrome c553